MTDNQTRTAREPSEINVVQSARYSARVQWTPEEIRKRRNERGLSQEDLGKAIGAGRRAVNNWENGRAVPQGKFVARLDAFLPDTSDSTPESVGPTSSPIEVVTEGVLLDEADFAQTLQHLAQLYKEALRAGAWLKRGVPPAVSEVLAEHDTVLGPPVGNAGNSVAQPNEHAESPE